MDSPFYDRTKFSKLALLINPFFDKHWYLTLNLTKDSRLYIHDFGFELAVSIYDKMPFFQQEVHPRRVNNTFR
ncbi:hypothetical protein JOC75_001029 [Metabacillus crassostreae]|nr:hypothetical protein [Metabacillus crassostreae]